MSGHVLVTAPASEPLLLGDTKRHLRVDGFDDDAYIAGLIAAARQWCEQFTRRALVTQTWKLTLDYFPGDCIALPRPPLASVTHVKYYDGANVLTTWSDTAYQVDVTAERGRIVPVYGETWPTTYPRLGAVEVQYVCGYGNASAVPEALRQAMLMMIGHWYEHREAVSDFQTFHVPRGADALAWPYRSLTA